MGLDVIDVALTDKGLTLCFVWILWFSVFWETVQLPGIKTRVKPRSWVLKEDAKICLYPPSHSPHRCLLCVFITTRHIHIRTRILTMWSCGSETHPLYNSPHQRQPEGVNANIYLPVKLFCSPLTYYSGTKTGDFFFFFLECLSCQGTQQSVVLARLQSLRWVLFLWFCNKGNLQMSL